MSKVTWYSEIYTERTCLFAFVLKTWLIYKIELTSRPNGHFFFINRPNKFEIKC